MNRIVYSEVYSRVYSNVFSTIWPILKCKANLSVGTLKKAGREKEGSVYFLKKRMQSAFTARLTVQCTL